MSQIPSLNALRALEAVIRTGSFRAAAEALSVTQSAISHQVRYLEDWFGAALFQRDGNRYRPLPHAEDLARTLTLSLNEIKTACERAKNHRISQPLVIAAIPSVAVCWLIPRLARFRALYPEIDIRIIYAIHGQDIDFHDAHLAIIFAKDAPEIPGIRTEIFLSGRSVPVCSPLIAQGLGSNPAADGMRGLTLLHDTDFSGWQSWFNRAGIGDLHSPTGPIFEDFNLLRAAALSGQGVALCAEAMIGPDLIAGHLVRLSSISVMEDFSYHLLLRTSASGAMQAKALAFRNWVMAERPD